MKMEHFIQLLITICVIGVALPAAAAKKLPPEEWNLSLTPFFLQGLAIEGLAFLGPESESAGLNFSNQFLKNEPRGRKVHVKATKDEWTLFADYQFIGSDPSTRMIPHHELLDLKAQITELGASYRFATWQGTDFEVLAGTRYKDQDAYSSPAVASQNWYVENNSWWQNGYIGLRFFTRFSENWTFIGRGDIGAGKDGNDFAWNAVAMLDYSPGDRASFYFGYKLLDFDYAEVDTGMELNNYDVLDQGPFIGFTVRW